MTKKMTIDDETQKQLDEINILYSKSSKDKMEKAWEIFYKIDENDKISIRKDYLKMQKLVEE